MKQNTIAYILWGLATFALLTSLFCLAIGSFWLALLNGGFCAINTYNGSALYTKVEPTSIEIDEAIMRRQTKIKEVRVKS